MKKAPFLISTVLSILAVVLGIVSFVSGQSKNTLQSEFVKTKQAEFQELNNAVTLQGQEYQRIGEAIAIWDKEEKNLMQPLLVEMGYRAAKNKNDKLKAALRDTKFEGAIFDEGKIKEMDKQIEMNKTKQGGTTPAPSTPPAPGASTTPATTAPALRP